MSTKLTTLIFPFDLALSKQTEKSQHPQNKSDKTNVKYQMQKTQQSTKLRRGNLTLKNQQVNQHFGPQNVRIVQLCPSNLKFLQIHKLVL